MKKKLIILILVAFAFLGWGQTLPYETLQLSGTTSGTTESIIRSLSPTSAVVFHQDGEQGVFSIIEGGLTMRSAVLPTGIIVKDFGIVDGSVYCCGSYQGKGMLAYFDIDDIVPGDTLWINISRLRRSETVTKMVAYYNVVAGGVGIAAIGVREFDSLQYVYTQSYMIECDNYAGTFAAKERPCFANDGSPTQEKLFDVVQTDNYVCYVGVLTNSDDITIRKGDINNVFGTNTINSLFHYYVEDQLVSPVVSAAIDSDRVAIAGVFGTPTDAYSTQIRVIDLMTMSMVNAQRMELDGKCDVHDIAFMPYDRTLLVLQGNSNHGMGSHVVSLAPMASVPYLASSTTSSSNLDYECIDIHDRECFLLACKNHWMLQNKFHHTMINSCSSISPVMIYPEELGRRSQESDFVRVLDCAFLSKPTICTYYFLNIVCNF